MQNPNLNVLRAMKIALKDGKKLLIYFFYEITVLSGA